MPSFALPDSAQNFPPTVDGKLNGKVAFLSGNEYVAELAGKKRGVECPLRSSNCNGEGFCARPPAALCRSAQRLKPSKIP